MNDWSRYLFGASIFFGGGVIMLAGRPPGWWTTLSLIVMFVAAAAFLIRSGIEYGRSCNADSAGDDSGAQRRNDQ